MLLFERIADKIADIIAHNLGEKQVRKEVIAYGAYILLDVILAISMVVLFGVVFGVLFQALLFSFTTAILRRISGGAHASTSFRCAIIGAIVSVGFSLLFISLDSYLHFWNVGIYLLITFALSYYIILMLAPKDSPNKPIVKEAKIKELKTKSLVVLFIYFVMCIFLLVISQIYDWPNVLQYIALICTGYMWQALTLTSLGHFIIKIFEVPFGYLKFSGGESK
jgi:accessory gene regulator B